VSFFLTPEESTVLVKLARKAVSEFLKNGRTIPPPPDVASKLERRLGVFVTLNSFQRGNKVLRGCIGFPYPTKPLVHAVIEAAISSATRDPRFSPVSRDEVDNLVVEISVLTPPELVKVANPKDYPRKIEVGKDGLIVEKSFYTGLLLPQVPVEWNWGEEEFLCQCCMKAGLAPDCWLLKDTKIYSFSCVIARETTPNGDVEIEDMRKG
jgi:uncharacterized protein (TIGR00296 family)